MWIFWVAWQPKVTKKPEDNSTYQHLCVARQVWSVKHDPFMMRLLVSASPFDIICFFCRAGSYEAVKPRPSQRSSYKRHHHARRSNASFKPRTFDDPASMASQAAKKKTGDNQQNLKNIKWKHAGNQNMVSIEWFMKMVAISKKKQVWSAKMCPNLHPHNLMNRYPKWRSF